MTGEHSATGFTEFPTPAMEIVATGTNVNSRIRPEKPMKCLYI